MAIGYTVGQVARLARVSVRTLHHYDRIGLLRPLGRTGRGYRRYGEADLERLALIRYYRELELSLEQIAAILADPGTDPAAHLARQHEMLVARQRRTGELITAIERAMEASAVGMSLTPQERFEVFGEQDPARYADEARQRWGDTDAYRESARRTRGYTKEQWLEIKASQQEIGRRFVAALAAGTAPDDPVAMEVAEAHRADISRWFYECSYEIHRGLAETYVTDPRFTENYERQAPGLARYVHDAILANAARHGG